MRAAAAALPALSLAWILGGCAVASATVEVGALAVDVAATTAGAVVDVAGGAVDLVVGGDED